MQAFVAGNKKTRAAARVDVFGGYLAVCFTWSQSACKSPRYLGCNIGNLSDRVESLGSRPETPETIR